MKPKNNYVPGPMDNCYSPPYAINPIIPFLRNKSAWECAQGTGNFVRKINQHYGSFCFGTDISNGCDFFEYIPKEEFDVIVTNPPFGLKYKFIERCYQLGKPFALLMPLEVLGAAVAQRMFEKNGIEIIFLSPRIGFKMPRKGWLCSPQFPTAWFCWKLVGKETSYYNFNTDNDYIDWKKYLKDLKNGIAEDL